MKFAIFTLITLALVLVLTSEAEAGVSSKYLFKYLSFIITQIFLFFFKWLLNCSGAARSKPGSCPNSRGFSGYSRSSHGGNGGGVGGGNGGIGGGNGGGRRCRSDGECYGVQKCCSSACVNPVAVVG